VVLRAGLRAHLAWWLPLALAGQTVTEGDGWPTHFPGLLGPALAALLVTAAQGPSGVGALLRRMGRWRIGLLGWLLAASPLALGAITVLVVGLTGQGWPQAAELGRYSGLPSLAIAAVWPLVVVANGWGEETGWRGYAQQQLQRRHSALVATLIVAVLWAAWHAPMFAVARQLQIPRPCRPARVLPRAALRRGGAHLGLQHLPAQHPVAAVWHGCYNLAAATQGAVAAVVTTTVMAWAIVLVVLEVRANRRGASVLAARTILDAAAARHTHQR
jgi:uncharacterized protein